MLVMVWGVGAVYHVSFRDVPHQICAGNVHNDSIVEAYRCNKSKKFFLDRKKFLHHSGGVEGEIPEFMLKRVAHEEQNNG